MIFNNKNKKKITIEGMMCEHCAKKVENALSSIENISKIKISVKDKCAVVSYDNELDENNIKSVIEALDYKVISIEEE